MFVYANLIDSPSMLWYDSLMLAAIHLHQEQISYADLPFCKQYFSDLPEGNNSEPLSIMLERTSALIDVLKTAAIDERERVLSEITEVINKSGGLVVERNFLRWEELQRIQQMGFSVGAHSANHCLFRELSSEDIAAEVANGLHILKEHNINPSPVHAYPEGLLTKDSREVLRKMGIQYSIANGDYPPPKKGAQGTLVLGRTPMYESVSFCMDFLACRLWGKKILS